MAELNPEFNTEVDLSAVSTAVHQPDADPEIDAGISETNEDDVPADNSEQYLDENIGEEPEAPKAEPPVATKTPSRLQSRIDGLVADKTAAERQATMLQVRLDNLHAALKGQKEPDEDDFEKYSDYVKALARYTAKQEEINRVEQAIEETVEVGQRATFESHKSRMLEGIEQFGEQFGAHVKPLADVFHVNSAAYAALFDSPEFANIANYLGHNIPEAQRIAGLSASQQTREIIKLENRFTGEVLQAPPKLPAALPNPTPAGRVSQAPAPAPARVVLTGKGPSSIKPDKESMNEYATRRQRELRKQGMY